MSSQLDLIVPLYNEEKNIDSLVEIIADSKLVKEGILGKALLVNNGSSDRTQAKVDVAAAHFSWIKPIHLVYNLNYGGGIYAGLCQASAEYLAYIPGDLQVHIDDLEKIWSITEQQISEGGGQKLLVKGYRKTRKDPLSMRVVSAVYSKICNAILDLGVRDTNGLPKLFHRSLVSLLPAERFKTFVFDVQILLTARVNDWSIIEVPVVFHARREGVSSWSGKRLRTYSHTFRQILKLRGSGNYVPRLANEK